MTPIDYPGLFSLLSSDVLGAAYTGAHDRLTDLIEDCSASTPTQRLQALQLLELTRDAFDKSLARETARGAADE